MQAASRGNRLSAYTSRDRGPDRRWALLLATVLAAVTALALAAPAAAVFPLRWYQPERITGPPFAHPTAITGISCPDPELCVAVDGVGDVLTLDDPTAGSGDWVSSSVDPESGFAAVSCPAPELCVAVDGAGNVFSSTKPAGGVHAWEKVKVNNGAPFEALSCPSPKLCLAGTADGDLVVSADPAGFVEDWTVVDPDGAQSSPIAGISCPSTHLCVAVSEAGRILTSTEPTGDNGVWGVASPPGGHLLFDVSCPATNLCVASGSSGDVLTSTDPPGGGGAWSATHVGEGSLKNVSCAPGPLCVASDEGGGIVTSTAPSAGGAAWSPTPLDLPDGSGGQASVESVLCPAEYFCALGDSASGIVTSPDPTGGESAWTRTALEVGYSALTGVACPAMFTCIAVDEAGNAATMLGGSLSPLAWENDHIDAHGLTGIDCNSACVAVDEAGGVVVSFYPWGTESATWTRTVIGGGAPLKAVSCGRNSPFCAAIDEEGNVLTSPHPVDGEIDWAVTHLADGALDDISCPLQELCVATHDGSVFVTAEPMGGPGAWTESYVNAGSSISCTREGVCVTVREDNGIVVTTEPLAGAGAWSESQATSLSGLDEVSCGPPLGSETLCVATSFGGNGSPGNVLETLHPTDGAAAWLHTNVYRFPIVTPDPALEVRSRDLTGVSCLNTGMCVVVDAEGRMMIGDGTVHTAPPPFIPEDDPPEPEETGGEARTQSGGPPPPESPPAATPFQIKRATVHCGGEIVLALYAPAAGTFRASAKVTALPDAGSSRRSHRAVDQRALSRVADGCDARSRPSYDGRRSSSPLYPGASARAAAAGTVRIAIRPRSPLLARRGLKVRVAITYLPRDGGRLTKRKTLPIG